MSAVDVLLKKLREDGPSGVSNPSTESITVWPSIPIDVVCLVLAQVLVGLTLVTFFSSGICCQRVYMCGKDREQLLLHRYHVRESFWSQRNE